MSLSGNRICVVEDDPIMGESLCDRFEIEGFDVDWRQSAGAALAALDNGEYQVLVSDVRLPDMSGERLYEILLERERPLPPVLFMTAYGDIDHAVRLLKLGAADYLTKPFDIEDLVRKVRGLCALDASRGGPKVETNLGISGAMRTIERALPRLARYSSTLLLTGESGVGKETTARRLHELGCDRPDAPFVAINCAAISEGLIETELFGHERGAFTGATRVRRGVFEQADGGMLFLDEIGDMPLAMQAKLLRVIQDKVVVRVGGEREIAVDLRLVCATNRDLAERIRAGAFREDLYYRINVIHLHVPPLRDRQEDILWLAEHALREHARRYPGDTKVLDASARRALLAHPWPGNVRELRHCIERACVLVDGNTLDAAGLFDSSPGAEPPLDPGSVGRLKPYLQDCERDYLRDALARNDWMITRTAAQLGISRKGLWERMRRLGIEAPGA